MKVDIVENFQGAVIQHGTLNNRIYLMKVSSDSNNNLPEKLIQLAQSEKYTKIFGKVPSSKKMAFKEKGYIEEASIPHFFANNETVHFMSYFLSEERRQDSNQDEITSIINLAKSKKTAGLSSNKRNFEIHSCTENDVELMAEIYKTVFPSYPFPISDPEYLKKTMRSHVDYFYAKINGNICALSSGEKDVQNYNAEMTDFATLPEFRGNGLAQILLETMELYLREKGIKTFYTICRAISPGMNICFAKSGYNYQGTLINNTNISGRIESMNIWSKP